MKLLAKFESKSNPERPPYEVRLGDDGQYYCTCPRWIYQHRPNARRVDCEHLRHIRKERKMGAQQLLLFMLLLLEAL